MGLCCQAMLSSFSLARLIFEYMFVWSVKLAGASNWQSQNNMFMALTYPRTVADQELWSIMSCLMKRAMILLYPGSLPHGSWMQCLFMKFRYTVCLNLVVSRSESDLSLDIFLSTIYPRTARLAWDSEENTGFQLLLFLLEVGIVIGMVSGRWFGLSCC